jgi:hypothetical protein
LFIQQGVGNEKEGDEAAIYCSACIFLSNAEIESINSNSILTWLYNFGDFVTTPLAFNT